MNIFQEVLFAMILALISGCSRPQDASGPNSEVAKYTIESRRGKGINEYFPGKLDPDIDRIYFSTRHETGHPNPIGVYSLNEKEYPSVTAILDELDKRRDQVEKAGIWYMCANKIGTEPEFQAAKQLFDYCVANDIDLFVSYPLGLPDPDGTNTYWEVESTKTRYVLPEESRNKREYLEW